MKYVPVMRYRGVERSSIKEVDFPDKFMPLLEIVKEKAQGKMGGNFEETYKRDFENISIPFMVDFPLYFNVTASTVPNIRKFLRPVQLDHNLLIEYYKRLTNIDNLIPTISYDPRKSFKEEIFKKKIDELKKNFNRLAFRIYNTHFKKSLEIIKKNIKKNDILIFDIDTATYNNLALKPKYEDINKAKKENNCITVLLRSSIPETVTNTGLKDDEPVLEIDNSLLNHYKDYEFDAFGDYAGIKKDTSITKGGQPSPGLKYYYWPDNCFIGFGHRYQDLEEFKNYILPNLIDSKSWKFYNENHENNCPGCKTLKSFHDGTDTKYKSQAKWKGIAQKHYLYTLKEFL